MNSVVELVQPEKAPPDVCVADPVYLAVELDALPPHILKDMAVARVYEVTTTISRFSTDRGRLWQDKR